MLRSLQDIRPAELEQALLTLPFSDCVALLHHLHHVLRRGLATELACKCVLFLLKIHHKQVCVCACVCGCAVVRVCTCACVCACACVCHVVPSSS